MKYEQFKKQIAGFRFIESESDVKYYWNLWNDSVKLDIKQGDTPNFDNFISLVSEGAR